MRAEDGGPARTSGRIDRGYLLLVGLTHDDAEERLGWMADKVTGLRLFGDAEAVVARRARPAPGGAA